MDHQGPVLEVIEAVLGKETSPRPGWLRSPIRPGSQAVERGLTRGSPRPFTSVGHRDGAGRRTAHWAEIVRPLLGTWSRRSPGLRYHRLSGSEPGGLAPAIAGMGSGSAGFHAAHTNSTRNHFGAPQNR